MEIVNDDQLNATVDEVNMLIQSIQNYLRRDDYDKARLRFPRGFIRKAYYQRERIKFISDETLRTNISYSLILSDVYHWILIRTDLTGTAKEMVIKASIFLLGAICESITKVYLKDKVSQKKGYKFRTKYLADKKIIDQDLKNELDWLWDMRSKCHLYQVEETEYRKYKVEDYDRGLRAFQALLKSCSER